MVARKVRDNLPVLLSTQWNEILSNNQNGVTENGNAVGSCVAENGNAAGSTHPDEFMDDGWCEQLEVEENGKLPEMYLPLKQSMLKAFKLMDKELKLHQAIDCFCSGTTTVALVKQVTLLATISNEVPHSFSSSFFFLEISYYVWDTWLT